MEKVYSEMVVSNLESMVPIFELTDDEFVRAVRYAEKIGFQSGKPSSVALAIIRIIKSKNELSNNRIYKAGKTEYNTVKKWTCLICRKLKIPQNYF